MNAIEKHLINSQQLDAVLPLTLKDYDRFEILYKSIEQFCPELIKTCWIVTPDRDFTQIKNRIDNNKYQIISESSLVPEFKIFGKTGGWYKQQVIKLAIAQKIETDFYLTLDADVICVKPVVFSDLVKNGKALCYALKTDVFPKWYKGSERVLQLQRSGRFHNVTPAILSKEAVIQLQNHLSNLSNLSEAQLNFYSQSKKIKILLLKVLSFILPNKSKLYKLLNSWKSYLLRNLPWTEYALYYTYLEATNLFDKYHTLVDNCIYSTNKSIWYKDDIASWKAEECFTGERDFFFCIVQSNTQINSMEVWNKVRIYLEVT